MSQRVTCELAIPVLSVMYSLTVTVSAVATFHGCLVHCWHQTIHVHLRPFLDESSSWAVLQWCFQ